MPRTLRDTAPDEPLFRCADCGTDRPERMRSDSTGACLICTALREVGNLPLRERLRFRIFAFLRDRS